MAKKDSRQEALDVIQPSLDEWSIRSPGQGAAFRDWAVGQVLWDEGLTWEEVQVVTATDGPGDMGIDGWYLNVETTPPTLFLFQSKDTGLEVKEMDQLKHALPRVFNEKTAADANVEVKTRASELRERFTDDLQVEIHFVTSRVVAATSSQRNHAEGELSTVHIPLFERSVPCRAFVHDIVDLARELKVAHAEPIPARFEVPSSALFEHQTAGKYMTAAAAIPALALVKMFDQHRTNLFRLNPRYYQSIRTTVNRDVLATLLGPQRTDFFLLNNGITAVCESLRITKTGDRSTLTIRDFQIVNGCQTTATLYEAWKRGTGDTQLRGVEVLVRVIEAPQAIAPIIARATNSQNPIKPEDFKSNDDRQVKLHDQFDKLTPPWFYEHKRGVWTTAYSRKADRQKYTDESGFVRHLEMKDLAQACLAFRGSPSDAIDRARTVFTDGTLYEKIFPERAVAQRLLLPYILFLRADAITRDLKAGGLVWAPYLRYPLAAIVGRWVREAARLTTPDYLSAQQSKILVDSIDSWAPSLFPLAATALRNEVESDSNKKAGLGARTLVRQSEWIDTPYAAFKRDVDHLLELEAKIAVNNGQKAGEIGLRSVFPIPLG